MKRREGAYGWPRRSPLRLNTLAALLAFTMIMASLLVAWGVFSNQLWRSATRAQGERVVNVATTLSRSEAVIEALARGDAPDPSSDLARRMASLRSLLDVNFIVVLNGRGDRLTHPNPDWIGHPFRGGDERAALEGERYVSTATGTLGTSIRGFAPVIGAEERVIGAVAVGVTLSHLTPLQKASRNRLLFLFLAILAIGGLGSAWLARTIKRRLMGMEPDEIARLVAERRAMLDAIHEGVIALDSKARVTLINPAAKALLRADGANAQAAGQSLAALFLDAPPGALNDESNRRAPKGAGGETPTLGRRPVINRRLSLGARTFFCNYQPMLIEDCPVGAVITFRDGQEMQSLAEELTGVKRYAEALRASTHEFKNKLHVILGLTRLPDLPALESYLHELIDFRHAASASITEQIREPVLAGFLIGKQSEAREKGIELVVVAETPIPPAGDGGTVHALVSIIGNLLENAFEALDRQSRPSVAIHMALEAQTLSFQVQDNGTGIDAGLRRRIFEKGVSGKGAGRGLGLHMVHAQIEAVEGTLSLYSSPGEGTLVEVGYPYRSVAESNRSVFESKRAKP